MKEIILKLGQGSFKTGFPHVNVELKGDGIDGWENDKASLLACPELETKYEAWERVYQTSVRLSRGTVFHTPTGTQAGLASIHQVKTDLITALNHWLSQGDFAGVFAQLRTDLNPDDRISLSIITDDGFLWKLPWHHWDFCKAYEHCVESFSKSKIQSNRQQRLRRDGWVDILAIWGNAPELGLGNDLAALQQPHARVTPCKPQSAVDISDALINQKQQTRILFFGGHGETIDLELKDANQTVGKIFLDKTTSISISKIKEDLKDAVKHGLQIAIFNCCSGMGLALELADLNIPYLIVMRSQIPDKLAQQFCRDLLATYSQGGDFTTAFHYARGRLVTRTDRDDDFESWLPMLVHNPKSNRVTWAGLSRSWWQIPALDFVVKTRRELTKPNRLPLTWIGISLLSTGMTMVLQTLAPVKELELKVVDRFQSVQAAMMPTKSRVVVLNINEPVKDDAVMVVTRPSKTEMYSIDEAQLQDLSSIPFAALGLDVQLEDRHSNSWLADGERKQKININCDRRSPATIYLPPADRNCPALAWAMAKNYAPASRSLGVNPAIVLNPHLRDKIEIKQLSDLKNNPDFFKDKIIFVGYVENPSSSVMIHAIAAESIASDRPLLTSYIDSIGNVYLLMWAGIGAASIFYTRQLFLITIIITGCCIGTGWLLFMNGYLLPIIPAAIVVSLSSCLVYSTKLPNKSMQI
jgi:hypothetical protein